MLVLPRRRNESITVGPPNSNETAVITVVEMRGDKVRLGIECPKEWIANRTETYLTLKQEKRNQATSVDAETTSENENIIANPGQLFLKMHELPFLANYFPFRRLVNVKLTKKSMFDILTAVIEQAATCDAKQIKFYDSQKTLCGHIDNVSLIHSGKLTLSSQQCSYAVMRSAKEKETDLILCYELVLTPDTKPTTPPPTAT